MKHSQCVVMKLVDFYVLVLARQCTKYLRLACSTHAIFYVRARLRAESYKALDILSCHLCCAYAQSIAVLL